MDKVILSRLRPKPPGAHIRRPDEFCPSSPPTQVVSTINLRFHGARFGDALLYSDRATGAPLPCSIRSEKDSPHFLKPSRLASSFVVLVSALGASDFTPRGWLRYFPKQDFSLRAVLMPAIKIANYFISAKFLRAWHGTDAQLM